jgi:hypothetical protein
MFGQILVMRLFRGKSILTRICGNSFMALKVAPPLANSGGQTAQFAAAVRDVVELAYNSTALFWQEGLALARRAMYL